MKLNYLPIFVILLVGISITSCAKQNIAPLKPIQEVDTSDKILTNEKNSDIEVKSELKKQQKNISNLVLKNEDLPLNKSYWSIKSESNDIHGYLGDSDQKSVLGGYIVRYKYHRLDLSQQEYNKALNDFELVQLILQFPLVNNTLNPQTSTLRYYLFKNDTDKFFWELTAITDAIVYYDLNLYGTSGSMKPHQKYSPFNVGEKEFIYSFNVSSDYGDFEQLYWIVFTKGDIIEEISIYGLGTNLELLKDLAISASNKIDQTKIS